MPNKSKQYGLTAIETQLLRITQQNLQAIMSNEMSMIAVQRLAYNVTANTHFQFNEDMSEVTISEDEPVVDEEETGVIGG